MLTRFICFLLVLCCLPGATGCQPPTAAVMPTATQIPTTMPAPTNTPAPTYTLSPTSPPTPTHTSTPTNTAMPTDTPTLALTQALTTTVHVPAGWQTYPGEGFELSLPPGWNNIDLNDVFEWAFSSAMVEDNPANKTAYTPIDAIQFAAWNLGLGGEIKEIGMMEIYAVPASAVKPPEVMAKQIAATFDRVTGPGTAKTQVVNLAGGEAYQVLSTGAGAACGGYVLESATGTYVVIFTGRGSDVSAYLPLFTQIMETFKWVAHGAKP